MNSTKLRAGAIIIVMILLACIITDKGFAQHTSTTETVPLETLLNSDGSLNTLTNTQGTIDPGGWNMTTGRDGAPVFHRNPAPTDLSKPMTVPEDDNWDDRFGGALAATGMNDEVLAMASDDKWVYVGGAFDRAGTTQSNKIARFDGITWEPLANGTSELNGITGSVVNAIAIHDNMVYVGGQLTAAGGRPVQHIARWNSLTKTWQELGSTGSNAGVSGDDVSFVSAIMVDGNDVYIGGSFTEAGDIDANNIVRWNAVTMEWSTLGLGPANGTQGIVNAIVKGTDGIYVGGSFSSAGGVQASGIARWDGTRWHEVGGGVNGFVNVLATKGDTVYVGGAFDKAGDTLANNVCRWYSDSALQLWAPLTGYFQMSGPGGDSIAAVEENGVDGEVRAIVVGGIEVYIAGTFKSAYPGDLTLNDVGTNFIARWRDIGSIETNIWWAPLGNGIRNGTDGFINALAILEDKLYVGGNFTIAGGDNAERFARWNGSRWISLKSGSDNAITSIVRNGEDIYAGGEFVLDNPSYPDPVNTIATLRGIRWVPVSNEKFFNGPIYAMASSEEYIYVAGNFSSVGNRNEYTVTYNVARWNVNTEEWSSLGEIPGPLGEEDYFSTYVSAIAIDGPYVYVGGRFSAVGELEVQNIARWNSETDEWSALGSGITGPVFSIAVDDETVFAGGRFDQAGETKAKNIAVWDGSAWSTVGDGTNATVLEIKAQDGTVYVGGEFSMPIGQDTAHSIAVWNAGTKSWSGLDNGVNDSFYSVVKSIAINGPSVYVGGYFRTAGNDSMQHIARWDGNRWSSLGSGVNSMVNTILVDDNQSTIYVAGRFTIAGTKPSLFFGIWTQRPSSVELADEPIRNPELLVNYPNPFSGTTTIPFTIHRFQPVTLKVYDMNGIEVAILVDDAVPPGTHKAYWDASRNSSGVYFYQLQSEGAVETRKLMVTR